MVGKELNKAIQVLFTLFGVGAFDATKGGRGEGRRASAKERMDVEIEEDSTVIRIHHVVVVQSATVDDGSGDGFGCKDVVDSATLFAGRDFRTGAVAMYKYVLEVVLKNERAELFVVVGVAEPGIKIPCDDEMVVGVRGQEQGEVEGELLSGVGFLYAGRSEEVPLLGEGSRITSRANALLAHLIDCDYQKAFGGGAFGTDEGPAAESLRVGARVGDAAGPIVCCNGGSAAGEIDMASCGVRARGDETVVTKMFAEACVAFFEGVQLFPVNVGLRKAADIDLVCCHMFGEEIEFTVVGFCVQAIGVLQEEA